MSEKTVIDLLRSIEYVWDSGLNGYYCPSCEDEKPSHEVDCELLRFVHRKPASLIAISLKETGNES